MKDASRKCVCGTDLGFSDMSETDEKVIKACVASYWKIRGLNSLVFVLRV